ncbi:CmpA/NrtA family ABC transporter substrate-binding protein [Brevundimonas sp.]|uniref:CmpA/NrtA family ABC transporter substrate-binding protein n=1 Tax=Brevundimonas sp. TaxID=1871086 RepID=UPI002737C371|nr:CmpA/NrtA family ABC transporter substrate-binding protein [Brevundimonas sp.]MDP3803227.1 CmpA/NrtA family ABC transporter substrate-binding protein [Brevundimonas sp.]
MTPISIAFLPLTDSAVLVAAKEQGFAAEAGLDLNLVRSTSWATVRDRLVYGQVQAAHMLAPLAVAVTLGLSQQPAPLVAPFRLNLNGNALTLSPEFAAALDPVLANRVEDPVATAHDFASAIGMHRRKPVIGVVHRFSTHALMLRYWLGFAGVDPDRDLTLRVLPPSLMVEALRAGEIDGFIAGEPWNSVAVAEGLGQIAAFGSRLWRRGVEKVLAMRADWTETRPEALDALLVALDRSAAWCDAPENHPALAAMLAAPAYVNRPVEVITPALSGRLVLGRGEPPLSEPDFLMLHREAANAPSPDHGLWIYSQFVRWGMVEASDAAQAAAAAVFRPDLYRRAVVDRTLPGPVEGFFDNRPFDPARIDDYVGAFKPGQA